ncbi:TldD/PmbA family protein [Thermodesulfovibrio yellowstonii]|uniref:TldD/PmbA family protein n=1 Tax=Thermodesulfovibrio yellowstonii TaxID=28262 RepID=UPI0003F5A2F0|nr:metallopeptidase TldD-related protein [Thermodesulfovibrio islandicus]
MHLQHTWNEYLDSVLKKIPDIHADWEIYFLRRKTHSVEGKDSKLDKKKDATREFFSIRVIKDKKAGFSICSEINKIPEAFQLATTLAQISDQDEFLALPCPEQIKKVEVFDEQLINKEESLPEILINMQKSALFDRRIKKLRNAEISFTIDEKGIINSKGISLYQPFTSIMVHIIAIAEERDSQMGWAYRTERFLKNINFEDVALEAGKKALMLLSPRKIKPFKGITILSPYVACEFLELIAQSISAENYQMGKSLFSGKIGQIVINEKLNIIDDALSPEKFGSTPFDAEGVPASKKVLIKNGILTSLLHNTYTANRAGTLSTGNAIRTDRGLSVGPTNLYIDNEGEKPSPEDLIKQVDKGIYVVEVMGMHTANPVSGDFSVGVSGIYIENGELKHPVKEVIYSGNVIELFKNIRALANDLKFFGNTGSPTLLVEGADISG